MDDLHPNAAARRDSTNSMGLAGFIVSIVSLIGCAGILSPLSLIFSLIGLGREPKGFAIAGLVLSIIGLLWFGAMFFFGVLGVILMAAGLGVLAAGAVMVSSVGENAFGIIERVHEIHESTGDVPPSLADLNLGADELTDTWGNRFVYIPSADGDAFVLFSAGPDGDYGTDDDYHGRIRLDGGFDFNVGQGYGAFDGGEWGDVRTRVIAEGETPLPGEIEGETPAPEPAEPPQTPEPPSGEPM